MRIAAIALGLALSLAGAGIASGRAAETPAQAIAAFGLVGTWSANCTSPLRLTYAIPASGVPTLVATNRGRESRVYEVQEAVRIAPQQLKVLYKIVRAPSPTPVWMPKTGEIWEAVYEKTGDRLTPLLARQRDGDKRSIEDGFQFAPEPQPDGTVLWKNTGTPARPLERCPN